VELEVSADIQSLLKPRRPLSEVAVHVLTGREWETFCTYIQMLKTKLSEYQEIISISKESVTERFLGVEDELGAALSDIGTG
jgi:hypothetical protein